MKSESKDQYKEFKTYSMGLSIGTVDRQRSEIHPKDFGHNESAWDALTPEERTQEMDEALQDWASGLIDYWIED